MFTTDGLYCTSKKEFQINLSKSAVEEKPTALKTSVKKILEIIVGLLKDRVGVEPLPASKRARVKKMYNRKA